MIIRLDRSFLSPHVLQRLGYLPLKDIKCTASHVKGALQVLTHLHVRPDHVTHIQELKLGRSFSGVDNQLRLLATLRQPSRT